MLYFLYILGLILIILGVGYIKAGVKTSDKIGGGVCLLIGILIIVIAVTVFPSNDGNNDKDNYVECGYCHKEFKKGSSNAMSIAKSHLCTECNENRKGLQDFIDKNS